MQSLKIRSTINSLLNNLVKNFIPISPMHFQISTGNSCGPTALPFSILLNSFLILHFFSSDTIYLFVNHFCFFFPRVSVISSFISFSKYSFYFFNSASEFIIHYRIHPLQFLRAAHLFPLVSVCTSSQSVQFLLTFFCF